MSGKGNCYDNAVAESFFKTLKTELIYAFKHGDFSGKGFTLKISDERQRLQFNLHNFKKQKSKDSLSGIGIGNVKKRLEILYQKNTNSILSKPKPILL